MDTMGGGYKAANFFNGNKLNTCTACSWGSCKAPFPHHAWYEFTGRHIPARFSFTRTSGTDTPKTWKFIGSPDKNCDQASSWTELCGDLAGIDMHNGAIMSCDVPKYARKQFRCLGIRVFSNNWSTNSSCMIDLRFWEVL